MISSSSTGVRAAIAADLPALGRLGALLVEIHHAFDPQRFLAPTSGTQYAYAEFLGRQLERPEEIVLVAERSGEVVGYVYAGVEGSDYMALRGPAGVLYDLIVDPAHRRQGVGSMLLDGALEALAASGVPRVVLSTAERNVIAQQMFERAGFRRTMVEMTRELQAVFR
jgi:ribosomal protein S18 acetylase RimI-like enzyme